MWATEGKLNVVMGCPHFLKTVLKLCVGISDVSMGGYQGSNPTCYAPESHMEKLNLNKPFSCHFLLMVYSECVSTRNPFLFTDAPTDINISGSKMFPS